MQTLALRARLVSDKVAMAAGLDVRLLAMLLVLATIWLGLNVLTGGIFLTPRNLFNLSLQVAVVGIMSCGMVLVIVSRHIDLSVGSQIGFIGVFGALLQTSVLSIDAPSTWWIAVLAMLGAGLLIGLVQGLLIAYGGVPSFVITLGGLLFFRNAAFYINSGVTIAPLNKTFQLLGGGLDGTIGAFWSWVVCAAAVIAVVTTVWRSARRRALHGMATRSPAMLVLLIAIWSLCIVFLTAVMNAYKQPRSNISMGLPIPVLILIGVTVAMSAIASKHRFGRHVFAMGGNPESAELAGIDTRRLTVAVFALMGLLVRTGLHRHHGAPRCRRERHGNDDRAQRHRGDGHRGHIARRRRRDRLWRDRRRAHHAEPRKRNDFDGRGDAFPADGARSGPDRRGVGRYGLPPGAGM